MGGSKTPLSYFPADMEGVEPPSSFSCEIEGFRSNMSLDSFSGLPAGESDPGADGRSCANTKLTFS